MVHYWDMLAYELGYSLKGIVIDYRWNCLVGYGHHICWLCLDIVLIVVNCLCMITWQMVAYKNICIPQMVISLVSMLVSTVTGNPFLSSPADAGLFPYLLHGFSFLVWLYFCDVYFWRAKNKLKHCVFFIVKEELVVALVALISLLWCFWCIRSSNNDLL